MGGSLAVSLLGQRARGAVSPLSESSGHADLSSHARSRQAVCEEGGADHPSGGRAVPGSDPPSARGGLVGVRKTHNEAAGKARTSVADLLCRGPGETALLVRGWPRPEQAKHASRACPTGPLLCLIFPPEGPRSSQFQLLKDRCVLEGPRSFRSVQILRGLDQQGDKGLIGMLPFSAARNFINCLLSSKSLLIDIVVSY